MLPAPIRLLIVDDSLETCDILENYFGLTSEIEVCGTAHDGEEALYLLPQCQPDVVLLDLIMPKIDGLAVLDRLRHAKLARRPRIIVTSAVGQETFTSAALTMGADYYMIKPYDLEDLRARVCTAAALGGETVPQAESPRHSGNTQTAVALALLELGLPAHMLGYRYCAAGVAVLLREDRPQSIVKDVYAQVAETFSTTTECVEGAMRKAIRRAWVTQGAAIRDLVGGKGDTPPSNGRFLTSLAQRIRLVPEGASDLGPR